ncbi:MAG: MATE family efflux transporter [Sphaerochaetaceae bacterium]|nr:MATE family efflux transporter [Sphaerochaetaceae bacterium]
MTELNKIEYKRFTKSAIALGTPIMLQNLLSNIATLVDTLMVGQLGEASIAAVGVASQVFFLVILFLFGVSSGSAIFIAQYWGSKDKVGIQKVIGLGMSISVLMAFIVAVISTLNPTVLMNLFSTDAKVVQEGNNYLKCVGVSYIFTAISFIWAISFRSTGDAKTPLFISLGTSLLNVIGNYLLIFGIGIFPELGVTGAALSTAISRFVELVCYLIITNTRKNCPLKINFKIAFHFEKEFTKKFFKTCAPVIFNEVFWSLGMVCYKIAYSKIGTNALAAVQVIESINNIFFVVMQGFANATAILIGNKIGEGDEKEARLYSKLSSYLAIIVGVIVGILIAFFSPKFLTLFNLSESVILISIQCMFVIAFLCPIKSFNNNSIVGILRSGGDTKYSMYLEMGSVWLVGVPLAFIGAMYLNLGLPQLYFLVGCEEITKFLFGVHRVKSGKWYNNLTI